MRKWSLLIALCIGMTAGYFVFYKPEQERKQLLADAQGPTIPEVVVLATAEINGIETQTFYVKSTNMVCTVAPSLNVLQSAMSCVVAKIGVHRRVLAIAATMPKL